jgi:hypothetical protein
MQPGNQSEQHPEQYPGFGPQSHCVGESVEQVGEQATEQAKGAGAIEITSCKVQGAGCRLQVASRNHPDRWR